MRFYTERTECGSKFKVGDIVRYSANWCEEGERHYLFTVWEVWDYRDTFGEVRYLIGAVNSPLILGSTEVVSEEMLELYIGREEIA